MLSIIERLPAIAIHMYIAIPMEIYFDFSFHNRNRLADYAAVFLVLFLYCWTASIGRGKWAIAPNCCRKRKGATHSNLHIYTHICIYIYICAHTLTDTHTHNWNWDCCNKRSEVLWLRLCFCFSFGRCFCLLFGQATSLSATISTKFAWAEQDKHVLH